MLASIRVFNARSILLVQQIVIDGSGHLLGRLASVVAKAVLQGIASGPTVRVLYTPRHSSLY